jgi:MarR family transcriptional regulator, 2-MHQ and catechol-resistance regulon repressor
MPTRYRGTAREVRALSTFIRLMRATETLNARLQQELTAHGLTQTQFGVLEALFHVGPMHQREIARKLLRSNANITTVLDNLERQGLVQRQRTSEDRRYIHVTLTPAGRQLIARVFPDHAARIADLLHHLSPTEVQTLGELCKKLGLALARPAQSLL